MSDDRHPLIAVPEVAEALDEYLRKERTASFARGAFVAASNDQSDQLRSLRKVLRRHGLKEWRTIVHQRRLMVFGREVNLDAPRPLIEVFATEAVGVTDQGRSDTQRCECGLVGRDDDCQVPCGLDGQK